jgi:hypothetical protein
MQIPFSMTTEPSFTEVSKQVKMLLGQPGNKYKAAFSDTNYFLPRSRPVISCVSASLSIHVRIDQSFEAAVQKKY